MADAKFLEKLKSEPLQFKIPCVGCRHLLDTGQAYGSKYRCGYPIPHLPIWAAGAISREQWSSVFTQKMIEGPFVKDAPPYPKQCAVREEA